MIYFFPDGIREQLENYEVTRTGDGSKGQAPADAAAHPKSPVLGPTCR